MEQAMSLNVSLTLKRTETMSLAHYPNKSTRVYPKREQVYTLEEVINKLHLRDSPSLNFWDEKGNSQVIQTSHILEEDLLTIPGFADSKWKYIMETHEWIPIFRYVDERPMSDFVTMEPWECYGEPGALWVIPKGYPRPQH
jgi:hypothetical protein